MPMSAAHLRRWGYAIPIAIVLLYAIWIIIGAIMIWNRQVTYAGHWRYVATHNLPTGYRLGAGDFKFDPQLPERDRIELSQTSVWIGKYLCRGRRTNESIGYQDLVPAPVIQVGPGNLAYTFSLQNQAELSEVLNAGSRVDVCAATCLTKNVPVAAIICDGGLGAKCSAVLELSQDQIAKIYDEGKAEYRLVVHGDTGR